MTPVNEQIENVVDLILEDYRHNRDIDKIEQSGHPDKDVIQDIIAKLHRIVFPGYAKEKNYNTSTYLGQPIVKFNQLFIKIDRKI